MKLQLTACSAKQAILDERIMTQHHQTRSSTRLKRILALVVEIGELANETRCFKYWSLKGPSDQDTLLEEFSDTLHFVLSLGLDLGKAELVLDNPPTDLELSELLVLWTQAATDLATHFDEAHFIRCLDLMGQVGDALGFTAQEVLDSYLKKNDKNHQRQNEAY